MKRLIAHIASLVSASLGHQAVASVPPDQPQSSSLDPDKVKVNKLNDAVSTFLAAHRSHQSHSSHGSHRSSSSGGYRSTPTPTPSPSPKPAPRKEQPRSADPIGQQPRPQSSYPPQGDSSSLAEKLKNEQLRKNIIMRMQLALQFEGLYLGTVDGIMGPETRNAVKAYKRSKGIPGDTVLDAETLNALGIKGF